MEVEAWEKTRKGAQERGGEEKMSHGTDTVKSRLLGGVRMERTAIPQPPSAFASFSPPK